MVYLDYSATTPVDEEVLNTFCQVTRDYVGNPNSIHKLGMMSHRLMEKATEQVADLLGVLRDEVIFTSSSSEANNLAIIGSVLKYQNRGKHIITTRLEHSSVSEVVSYLESVGFRISYVSLLPDGRVDLDDLKRLIDDDTILVSIGYVNSELGICQDVEKIGKMLKKYVKVLFHVDGTQAVGKIPLCLDDIDLFSFSAHKFYGLKGIACLVKKRKIELIPIVHGGKSQSNYRSGTPALPLIVSMAKSLRLALSNMDERLGYVTSLNKYLKEELLKINRVVINSMDSCIPHIINISVLGIKPETLIHALEEVDIYVSTKTACSSSDGASSTLIALGKEAEVALSSIRISLSYKTTREEVDYFLKNLKIKIKELNFESGEY